MPDVACCTLRTSVMVLVAVVVMVVGMMAQVTNSQGTVPNGCLSCVYANDPCTDCTLKCNEKCPDGYYVEKNNYPCTLAQETTRTTTIRPSTPSPASKPQTRLKRDLAQRIQQSHALSNEMIFGVGLTTKEWDPLKRSLKSHGILHQDRIKRQVAKVFNTTPDKPTTKTVFTTPDKPTTKAVLICAMCATSHCSNCTINPTLCHECKSGFKLVNETKCMAKDDDDDDVDDDDSNSNNNNNNNNNNNGTKSSDDNDTMNISIIIGSAVGGGVFLIVVVILIVGCFLRVRRQKQSQLSGGCSLDLVTTERIPSTVKESQEHVYGNMAFESSPKLSPKKTKKERKRAGSLKKKDPSPDELNEIYDLGEAPRPPEDDNSNNYDALDLKSRESTGQYTPMTFNDVSLYENIGVAQMHVQQQQDLEDQQQDLEDEQRHRRKQKEAAEQQNGNDYTNTSFHYSTDANNDNLSSKIENDFKTEDDSSGEPDSLVPPSYDSVGGDTNSLLHKGSQSVRSTLTKMATSHQQEQKQQISGSVNRIQQSQDDDIYEEPDPSSDLYRDDEVVYQNV